MDQVWELFGSLIAGALGGLAAVKLYLNVQSKKVRTGRDAYVNDNQVIAYGAGGDAVGRDKIIRGGNK
jgi:hypothetical protein